MNYDLPDHPVIQNMERTGYPDGKEPTFPICPVCGEECEEIFRDKDLNIVGCDNLRLDSFGFLLFDLI